RAPPEDADSRVETPSAADLVADVSLRVLLSHPHLRGLPARGRRLAVERSAFLDLHVARAGDRLDLHPGLLLDSLLDLLLELSGVELLGPAAGDTEGGTG